MEGFMTKQNDGAAVAEWLRKRTGMAWYLAALIGQGAFVYFIAAFYGSRTVTGHFSAWNDKPLITGYVAGDSAGNFMFAAHVLLAAVVTLGGLVQLVPFVRSRLPGLHRWNGRLFFVVAVFLAVGGLWLTWIRKTQLSLVSAVAISVNGLLILISIAIAWRYAIARRIAEHRPWAMRTYLLVNGVWFLRVGMMGWTVINQGRPGMNNTLSGPVDVLLVFGAYLVPLLAYEAYDAAGRSRRALPKILATAMLAALTAFMAIGIFGTIALMWGPYL
jgi:hypothetical protein